MKYISFDMEGTLIDHGYSEHIWGTDIPRLYAEKHGVDLEEARRRVFKEYNKLGDARPEWYDVGYWFRRFSLPGDWRELPERRRQLIRVYPDAKIALDALLSESPLVVSSNTIREFLEVQVEEVGDYFTHIFSAPSDYQTVKKDQSFYRKIIEVLGIEPNEMIHVGDHYTYDYLAAQRIGIEAYHLDRTGKTRGENTLGSLTELMERLKKA
jgi:FMN phosphatase YigB (HAD superfamily)